MLSENLVSTSKVLGYTALLGSCVHVDCRFVLPNTWSLCTAIGNLDHSLIQDCATMIIYI